MGLSIESIVTFHKHYKGTTCQVNHNEVTGNIVMVKGDNNVS